MQGMGACQPHSWTAWNGKALTLPGSGPHRDVRRNNAGCALPRFTTGSQEPHLVAMPGAMRTHTGRLAPIGVGGLSNVHGRLITCTCH